MIIRLRIIYLIVFLLTNNICTGKFFDVDFDSIKKNLSTLMVYGGYVSAAVQAVSWISPHVQALETINATLSLADRGLPLLSKISSFGWSGLKLFGHYSSVVGNVLLPGVPYASIFIGGIIYNEYGYDIKKPFGWVREWFEHKYWQYKNKENLEELIGDDRSSGWGHMSPKDFLSPAEQKELVSLYVTKPSEEPTSGSSGDQNTNRHNPFQEDTSHDRVQPKKDDGKDRDKTERFEEQVRVEKKLTPAEQVGEILFKLSVLEVGLPQSVCAVKELVQDALDRIDELEELVSKNQKKEKKHYKLTQKNISTQKEFMGVFEHQMTQAIETLLGVTREVKKDTEYVRQEKHHEVAHVVAKAVTQACQKTVVPLVAVILASIHNKKDTTELSPVPVRKVLPSSRPLSTYGLPYFPVQQGVVPMYIGMPNSNQLRIGKGGEQ